jgi:hypothetical protein
LIRRRAPVNQEATERVRSGAIEAMLAASVVGWPYAGHPVTTDPVQTDPVQTPSHTDEAVDGGVKHGHDTMRERRPA